VRQSILLLLLLLLLLLRRQVEARARRCSMHLGLLLLLLLLLLVCQQAATQRRHGQCILLLLAVSAALLLPCVLLLLLWVWLLLQHVAMLGSVQLRHLRSELQLHWALPLPCLVLLQQQQLLPARQAAQLLLPFVWRHQQAVSHTTVLLALLLQAAHSRLP
jgi:hypothetical protein